MGEFEFIDSIRKRFAVPEGFTGIGDDCAVIPRGDGLESLVTKDMLVEGIHFLLDRISAYDLGWKSAAVNISDIAAMGGTPLATFLSIALPPSLRSDKKWLDDFVRGYSDLSARYSCPLLGGDTCSSPDKLCIDVAVLGSAPAGRSVKRSGALSGDLICVSGCLGDSGAGLKLLLGEGQSGDNFPAFDGVCSDGKSGVADRVCPDEKFRASEKILIEKHCRPVPRVEAGKSLAAIPGVHSMMDLSDGLASDLRHILRASGLSAHIECSSLPLSAELLAISERRGWDPLELALTSGEDYELLFSIAPDSVREIEQALEGNGCHLYIIGNMTGNAEINAGAGPDIEWVGTDRDFIGFRHF